MFNAQAAISTLFFMVMLGMVTSGVIFLLWHKWLPMRILGGFVLVAAFVGIVSHLVALIVGA